MYAIAFDIDTKEAERILGRNWRNCYGSLQTVFAQHRFSGQQGSLYFGPEGSNAVDCVLVVQDIDRKYSWFGKIVRDLRMMRVEEQNDLIPALSTELRFEHEPLAAS